jgi:disulfide bond formation protein DsbB
MNAVRLVIRWWVAFALLASIAMLAIAFAFQYLGGLAPCHLCMQQRYVYGMAIVIALPATLWALFFRSRGTPKLAALLLTGVFVTGAIVAGFHAGVELKWWPGPSSCTSNGADLNDLQGKISAIMSGAKLHTPMCDVIAWSWGGLSMAGWNMVGSIILAVISLIASIRRKAGLKEGVGEGLDD